MKILVTGGTGFVGSHIIDKLLEDDHSIVATIRQSSNLRWIPQDKIETVLAPLGQCDNLESILPDIDIVIHAAGITKATKSDNFFKINTTGTQKLLELCKHTADNLKKFVFISSQAAGCPGKACDSICEKSLESPMTSYGKSKLEAEKIAETYSEYFDIGIIRPPSVYGPRDSSIFIYFKIVNMGILPFIGSPERQFSLVYVEDLARAVNLILQKSTSQFSKYYVCDGPRHTWREFGTELALALGKKPLKLRLPKFSLKTVAAFNEIGSAIIKKPVLLSMEKSQELCRNWVCHDNLIREELGFVNKFDLKTGLQKTVKWYRENDWL